MDKRNKRKQDIPCKRKRKFSNEINAQQNWEESLDEPKEKRMAIIEPIAGCSKDFFDPFDEKKILQEMNEDMVFLKINDKKILCSKSGLADCSGYFRAMFYEGFAEANKKIVEIHDNDYEIFNHLIKFAKDTNYFIPESDRTSVLQAAFLFQFDNIISDLVDKVVPIISTDNCLQIWKIAEELNIDRLKQRAKMKALMEFNTIRTTMALLNLNLNQICKYLGSVFLNCSNEMIVFETAMCWFQFNYQRDDENRIINHTYTAIKLLGCVDLKKISTERLQLMLVHEAFAELKKIKDILSCIIAFRLKADVKSKHYDKDVLINATKLNSGRSRRTPISLCMLVDESSEKGDYSPKRKMIKYVERKKDNKKLYIVHKSNEQVEKPSITKSKVALFYDCIDEEFHKIACVNERLLCSIAENAYVVNYKDSLLFLGLAAEMGLDLIYKYTSYSTITEKWIKFSQFPDSKRKYFSAIVCGDVLYILGGIGRFRTVQDNMLAYDIKTKFWHDCIQLPFRERQVICCNYNNALFIMNIAGKCGYLYNKQQYKTYIALDEDHILENFDQLFTVFAHNNVLYLMGNKMIVEMVLEEDKLKIFGSRDIEDPVKDYDQIESSVCENFVYCLYKSRVVEDERTLTLLQYNLISREFNKIFDNIKEDYVVEIKGNNYHLNLYSKIVPLLYHKVLEKEEFINEL